MEPKQSHPNYEYKEEEGTKIQDVSLRGTCPSMWSAKLLNPHEALSFLGNRGEVKTCFVRTQLYSRIVFTPVSEYLLDIVAYFEVLRVTLTDWCDHEQG